MRMVVIFLGSEHGERRTLGAQWQFGRVAFAVEALAGREDSLEGRGGLGNFRRVDKVLWNLCYANLRRSPTGSHLTFRCLAPRAYFLGFLANYDPKHTEKYSGHGQFVRKPKCLWNNTMLRTEGKGKQNPTLCCKSTALLSAVEIPLVATLPSTDENAFVVLLSVKKSHPVRPRRSRASPQLKNKTH